MDYEFKNKNTNKKVIKEVVEVKEIVKEEEQGKIYKSKKPWFVWSNPKPKTFATFEDMVQAWILESRERNKGLQREFISNNQLGKLAIKKSKYIASKNKQEN